MLFHSLLSFYLLLWRWILLVFLKCSIYIPNFKKQNCILSLYPTKSLHHLNEFNFIIEFELKLNSNSRSIACTNFASFRNCQILFQDLTRVSCHNKRISPFSTSMGIRHPTTFKNFRLSSGLKLTDGAICIHFGLWIVPPDEIRRPGIVIKWIRELGLVSRLGFNCLICVGLINSVWV